MAKEPSPIRNVYISLTCLIAVLAFGTLGYMFFFKWGFVESLYMTIITLASVGFREVRTLDSNGEFFTIVLIIFGMGSVVYGITNLTAFVVEGDLRKLLRKSRMDRNIEKLKDHFILCGLGRVGKNICKEILSMGQPLVVIDNTEDNFNAFSTDEKNFFPLLGDATEEKTLEKANIKKAKGFISALPTDSENVFVVLSARQLNPQLRIIARANEEENSSKLFRAGADKVVCPSHIGGLRMASELLRPVVVDFLDMMVRDKDVNLRVEEATISANSPFANKTLIEAQIPKQTKCVVVALRKEDGSFHFNPVAETRLKVNDTIVVIGEIENINRLKKLTAV